MKTITEFSEKNNLIVSKVRYKHQFGYCKRKGYDLIKPNGKIVISFEPTELSGTKWYVRNAHNNYNGPRYINRITKKLLNEYVNVNESSFFTNLTALLG